MGHEQAVEWITVDHRKLGDPRGDSRCHGPFDKAHRYGIGGKYGNIDLEGGPAQSCLYSNFPDRSCAEEHLIARLLNGGDHKRRQAGGSYNSPQQHVGIEY